MEILNGKWTHIIKCQGQGYDGALTMSGQSSGLQKRIKNLVPNDNLHSPQLEPNFE